MYRATGLRKSYGGIAALNGVDFSVDAGTVHGLIGENGAGKSTLLKVLAGALTPDEGALELDGQPTVFSSPAHALGKGIAIVSQELSLFPDVDLVGNLFPLGAPTSFGLTNKTETQRRCLSVLDDLGLVLPLRTLVGDLTLADQQLVEIARAVISNPKVLILDEPTSALDRFDAARVHAVLDVLRDRNVAVVYVSHVLEDVLGCCDQVTVLRDGSVEAADIPSGLLSVSRAVELMIGSELELPAAIEVGPSTSNSGSPLVADELRVGNVDCLSFSAFPGEVIGFAGLAGAGQRAVFEALAGTRPGHGGTVVLPNGLTNPGSIRHSVQNGVAIVSGDRKRYGLHLEDSIWRNVAQVRSLALGRSGRLLKTAVLHRRAEAQASDLKIKANSMGDAVGSLSGGNQQKVVFAKWAESDPDVILMDDPTRGIDVGGRSEVWRLIGDRASKGQIQVIISSDAFELASVCHRVLIFRNGEVSSELTRPDITTHGLVSAINTDPIQSQTSSSVGEQGRS